MSKSQTRLCPLRPTSSMSADSAEPDEVIEGWDAIKDADVLPHADEIVDVEDLDEIAEDGTTTQRPIPVPSPSQR